MSSNKSIHTLLIVRTSAIGDVAMTIPAIYSLARQHEHLRIKILTQPRFIQMFLHRPENISFISFDYRRHKGIKGMVRLLCDLDKEEIDAVADFHNVLRSWIIDFYFSIKGIPVSFLKKQRMKRYSILHRQSANQQSAFPFVLRYFDVLKKLGLSVVPDFVSLIPNFQTAIHKEEKWIGIAPFARYSNKMYPTELMEELIKKLNNSSTFRIFLFGFGEKEFALMETWEKRYEHVFLACRDNGLEKEIDRMAQMDTMITMDSANMHIASLVAVPVISIWGSTTPQCGFLGWGQSPKRAICSHVDCQPCTTSGSNVCQSGDLKCMYQIRPETILQQIKEVLNEKYAK